MKPALRKAIDDFISETQSGDDVLDMWISDTLIDAMTDAAWSVLRESRNTQKWMKREGHTEDVA